MTTFPNLEPVSTSLGYGNYPQNIFNSISGANVRFKLGSKRVDQILIINYEHLTESETQTILTHFNDQNGSIDSFDLSSIIWSKWTTPPVDVSLYQWRYNKPLNIEISAPNKYKLSIELISTPI